MTIPRSEVQTLSPGALVTLYEVDATGMGGLLTRWAPHLNKLGTNIIFGGNEYQAFPVTAEGFETSSEGPLPHPKLRAANLDGQVGLMCRDFDDLVGAIVTRRQTLEKFLDAVNFPGGVNPTAGPYEYRAGVWVIEQKTGESVEAIEWELSPFCDASGVRLPARGMGPDTCGWSYVPGDQKAPRGAGTCIYAGTCPKTLTACKTNHGETAELPFGGFPGLPRVRR